MFFLKKEVTIRVFFETFGNACVQLFYLSAPPKKKIFGMKTNCGMWPLPQHKCPITKCDEKDSFSLFMLKGCNHPLELTLENAFIQQLIISILVYVDNYNMIYQYPAPSKPDVIQKAVFP